MVYTVTSNERQNVFFFSSNFDNFSNDGNMETDGVEKLKRKKKNKFPKKSNQNIIVRFFTITIKFLVIFKFSPKKKRQIRCN